MGNVSDRQIQVVQDPRIYFQTDLPKFIYEERIGNGKFMKSYLMKIDDTAVAVKVYLKPADDDVDRYAVVLTRLWQTLSPSRHPYLLPYQMWIKSSTRVARPQTTPHFLIRQYFPFNLYDRLSTRPFLSNMEKLWLIYQLMRAVEECHKEGISHGDIKPENVMVTSWNWVVLTDFAPYKPVFIPNDDPTDFHYFFDSMGRRRCSLAPERFISRQKSAVDATCDAERSLLPAMDTFSLGCTIAEVLLDGEPLLDLPTMLRYKAACEDPSGASQMTSLADADSPALQTINRIRDHRMRQAIVMMTSHNPAERESVHSCRSRLEECQVFPAYFNGTLYDFFLQLHAKGTTPDDKIGIICKNYGALMEHIAGCVDEEGARFFDRALCRVYNRAEGTDEDRTSQDLDDNARSDPMETYVDLAAARYRRSNVTGEASVKALKSKVVKFSSGRSVASCLEEAVQQQSDTNTTDVGKSTGGGSSLLAKALQTADEKSGSSSLATKSIDDRAMVELIDQFEKLIDDARRSSQLSADDVQATPTTPAPASSSFKNSAGRTTGSGDDKQHGEVSPAERTDREGNTKSQLQSFSSLVFALRGDGSKLFDVDETPSGGSITHYQPSSLSPYVESVSEIREEVQGRLHKRHSEEMSGGLLLVIQIICSTIRYLRHPQSRVTSLMLLSRLGSLCNDIVILERIVPFIMLAIEDPVAVVRATALRCLRSLLNAVTEISEVNSNIFKEFIFPALDNVVAKDTEAIVRIAFAESIGKFAETSMRFLDVARFMHQNKCISAVTGEGGITADGDSAVQVLVEGSYDAQAAALHQHVSKWIRDLVLDGNIGMSMDSKNDAKRQMPSGSHSSIVKRAILEDVVRLCVFFGKQEKIMDLFAQLLAYVNHQDWDLDWELRNAFCIKIPLVCAFLGPAVTSECILPFLEKARVDVHEMVVASAVRCIWTLVEMQLLARPLVVDVVSKTVPLLLHPSAAIRNNAIGMIEAAAKLFGVTDSYVFLLPYVRPILQCDLIGFEITRKSLMESLVRPIQRSAYQRAVREWPQSMGGGAAGGIGGEQTPSSGENRGRGDSVLSVDLEGKGIDGVDVSGVLVETDMAMSTVLDGNRLNDADGNELAKSIVSAGVEVIPPFKNSKSSAGFVDEDASKLQFLKEYIEMALKENPSRSSLWKGVSNTPSSRRSSSRRQSSSSFRSSAPMSLDSLLDVFSYQTLSTLSDHFVHSVFVPHEKYSLLHSVPDQLRIMTADPNIQPAIDLTWFKSMYGIDVDQSLEGGGRGGTTGYYETEQTQLSSTPTQPRPSAVMAGTPPPQYQQHSRRNMSRMSSAPDLLNGVGTDLGRALKSDEVSIGELHGIRRKIKALNIPPLSPDFGSLVQPTDGRPYSMFVESLDVTQAGDALSGQPWRPKENTVVSTLFEHTGAVNRIALSQDQSFFVSASSDGTAKVWQVKGVERNAFPRSAVTYSKHNGRLMDAAIIENSHSVATCSDNGAIHVWRVDLGGVGGKRAHSHYAPSGPPQMSSNSDLTPPSTRQSGSTSLAWGSSTIKILSHDEGPVLALQHFTGDVASVLTFISRRGLVHGWDLRCSQEAFLYSVRPELGYPTSMVCSPDRNWISVGTSQGYIGLWDIRYNVMCKLWRHSSGTPIHRLACAKSSPNVHSTREGVLASAEGAYMFVASGNNEAAVWAVPEGGECLKCFRSVSMTAARSALASLPQLHDIPIPSHPLAAFQGGSVQYMNRSPISTSLDNCAVRALVGRVSHTSASYLVTAGTDRSIRYWDFTSPTRCFTVSGLDAAQPKPVYETPPSPALRGKLFLCYDSAVPSVKATLQSQLPLREYRGTLPRVANYKDAILDLKTIDLPIRMMISASRDGEIKLWR